MRTRERKDPREGASTRLVTDEHFDCIRGRNSSRRVPPLGYFQMWKDNTNKKRKKKKKQDHFLTYAYFHPTLMDTF